MQQLVERLSALDPEVGAALKVITYFDKLNAGRVGLETLVRGAAVLSGHPAGLHDPERHVDVRVFPDGAPATTERDIDPDWMSTPLLEDGSGLLWLETIEQREIDDLILERLVMSVRATLDRTRRRVVRDDGAALEVLLSSKVGEDARLAAARQLGWAPTSMVRVIAYLSDDAVKGSTSIEGVGAVLEPADRAPGPRPRGRIGVGGQTQVTSAWRSWQEARVALRFTTADVPSHPSPSTLHFDDLGIIAELARTFTADSRVPNDVLAVERAAETAPWLYQTLTHLVRNPSQRSAAEAAHLHHSTMRARIAHAESLLGWSISDQGGRFRLQVALTARVLIRGE